MVRNRASARVEVDGQAVPSEDRQMRIDVHGALSCTVTMIAFAGANAAR
jgi:hypothetical protein